MFVDLTEGRGAFLYGWGRGRLLCAIDADRSPRRLTSPRQILTVMTRVFRVLQSRPGRVARRTIAAIVRILSPVSVAVALLASSGEARAQMTQTQKDEVKLHYQRATRAYDLQKYQEAIDE